MADDHDNLIRFALDKRHARAGFTLVEVLVVLAIIGLIVAILLPAIGRVRDSARAAGCASNTRQLMAAFITFASDHKGQLPGNYWDSNDPDRSKRCWLLNAGQSHLAAPQAGTLFRYLKDERVYRCPSQAVEVVGSGMGSNGRFDYSSIPQFAGAPLGLIQPIAQFRRSNGSIEEIYTPIVIEEDPMWDINHSFLDSAHCAYDKISPVHQGGGYYGTADGSVHWMQQDPHGSSFNIFLKTPSGKWLSVGPSVPQGWGSWVSQ